jgi:hypothetical protein
MNLLGRLLLNINSIVEEQVALSISILVQRNDQTPRTQSRGLGGVASFLDGHDIAASDVNRLVQEGSVQRLVLASSCFDFFEGVPVVPSGPFSDTGEDSLHRRRQWSEYWRHEKCRTRHELRLDAGQLRVIGKFPRQSAEDSLSCFVCLVEQRVGVREERIADVHDATRRLGCGCPAISFLSDCVAVVVVPLCLVISS